MRKANTGLVVFVFKGVFRFAAKLQIFNKPKVSSALNRSVALLLVAALMAPVFLFSSNRQAFAAQNNLPLAVQAPPQAFASASSSSFAQITSLTSGAVASAKNVFSSPSQQVEGFGIAGSAASGKTISVIGSSFVSSLGSFFGFFGTENNSTTNNPGSPLTLPAGSVRFDFDGDGKADIGSWKSSNQEWKIKNSSTNSVTTYALGTSSSSVAPGDYDGDGKTDMAVFTAGTWLIKRSSDAQTITVSWGMAGDKAVPGDYEGDGKTDVAIFRPSTNTWWIFYSSTATYSAAAFGTAGDITVQGNYDGDNKTDLAVFRPSTGYWYVQGSSAGFFGLQWGSASDVPLSADFDGDATTDFAVYRGATGTWFVLKSSTGFSQYISQTLGKYGDQPVPADYDGDGTDDFAVWQPTAGTWSIIKSSNSSVDSSVLGVAGDVSVPSAYLRQTSYVYGYDFAKTRLSPKNSMGGTDLYSRNFGWETTLVSLKGRAGLDMELGISYNSLVWTKDAANNAIVFNVDNSNVSPGFRFGFSTVEPAYYDSQTSKFLYLMVTPSGERVEFRQTAALDTYETTDSSYRQLKINGSATPNDPAENLSLTITSTDGIQMLYEWKGGAYRCQKIIDHNGNYISINHDANGLLQTVTDSLGRVLTVNYSSDQYPTSITQTWKNNNGQGSDVQHTWATFTYTTKQIQTDFSGLTVIGPGDAFALKVLQKVTLPTGSYRTFDYNSWGQVKQVNDYGADNHLLNYKKLNFPNDQNSPQSDCPRFTETRNWIENFNLVGGTAQETVVTNSITPNYSYSLPDGNNGTETLIQVSMQNDPTNHVSKTIVGSSGWKEGLPIASEDWADGASGAERKRWTWNNWTQDDTNLSYILNPRVTISKVGDASNIKKTELDYKMASGSQTVSDYVLVSETRVYDGSSNALKKKTTMLYQTGSAYLSRRIIGLPNEVNAYGDENGSLVHVSKVTYQFDEGDFTQESNQIVTPVQHDAAYGSSFTTGRGNLTSITRHDPSGLTASLTSSIRYDIAGSPVAQIMPWTSSTTRKIRIEYADNFIDGTNRNTFAYPKFFIDALGSVTTSTYRYDIGADVRTQTPAPAGQTVGKINDRIYDSAGRLEKDLIVNNGAYVRYEYDASQVLLTTYATVTDGQGETKSELYLDGAGRKLRSRSAFSWSGSNVSTWSGQINEYDILGRIKRQTPQTEITSSWQPTNEDNRGTNVWLWTSQDYDWKGRVVQITNTDGSTREMNYEGCGCAGGEVVTVKGEEIIERNWQGTATNNLGRRTQKIYSDLLGRNYKTEIYNWNGTGTPYSTTVSTFNARDQVTLSRQYDGASSASVYQDTTMTYDGHGRLKTHHTAEQDAGTSTVFDYNYDGSLQKKTDARGAASNYTYNARGQMTQVSYDVPPASYYPPYINYAARHVVNNNYVNGLKIVGGRFGSDTTVIVSQINYPGNGAPPTFTQLATYNNGQLTRGTEYGADTLTFIDSGSVNYSNTGGMYVHVINNTSAKVSEKVGLTAQFGSGGNFNGGGDFYGVPQTPTVSYEYDAATNLTAMNDGEGRIDYKYDEMSRLTSENRDFNNITNPSSTDGSYKLSYEYTLFGALKSITDPYNARINYTVDKIGRTTAVTGAVAYAGLTNYATELQYRAWGAGKHLKYGNDSVLNIDYNTQLNPSQYELLNSSSTSVMKAEYKYYSDNRLQFVNDLGNDRLDRKYAYDQTGRLTGAESGYAANGQPYSTSTTGPYGLSYGHDSFDNLTSRYNYYWYSGTHPSFNTTYVNNRNQNVGWTYDPDGRAINFQTPNSSGQSSNSRFTYDASGQQVQGVNDGNGQQIKWSDRYYVRSTVLGGAVISEVSSEVHQPSNHAGLKLSTYVYFEGRLIAEQTTNGLYAQTQTEVVVWKQKDPLNTSSYGAAGQVAIDPNGISTDSPNYSNLNQYSSYYSQYFNYYNYGQNYNPWQGTGYGSSSPYSSGGGAGGVPGNPTVCTVNGVSQPCGTISSHEASPCPNNNCGAQYITINNHYSPEPGWQPSSSGFYFFTANADGTIGYNGTLKREFNVRDDDADGAPVENGYAVWYDPIFLEFPNFDAYWAFRETHPIPPEGKEGTVTTQTTANNPNANPCPGPLDYSRNLTHIVENHIDQLPQYVGRKSVYGRGIFSTPNRDSRIRRTQIINNLTFRLGGLTIQTDANGRNTYVYVLAIDAQITNAVEIFVVGKEGREGSRPGQWTNVNTLIVGHDCKTVITSHPGKPASWRTPNPVIVGNPKWWSPTWVLPF
jgi:YD repeat-containing protein